MIHKMNTHIGVLFLATVMTSARTIVPSSSASLTLNRHIITNTQDATADNDSHMLHRSKRQSYVPSDYYANYYNDYYNNYYNNIYNGGNVNRPASSADRFDGNTNDYDSNFDRGDDNTIKTGQKYVYTPLFQYKATHQKKQKLFVPNLFG